MKTGLAGTFPPNHSTFGEVHIWPRRPAGWEGATATLHPFAIPRTGSRLSDGGDLATFAATVVADLRSRDPHRAYADLHAIARPPREPVLVTDRTKVGLMFRRLVAEWLVNSILGLPPIPEMEPGALALSDILRLDPWAAL